MQDQMQILLLALGVAIAGCNVQPVPSSPMNTQPVGETSPSPAQPSPDTTDLDLQEWVILLPGASARGISFTTDAALAFEEKVLLAEVPVSYGADDTVIYAARLMLSPTSPSERYSIVKACEDPTPEVGLCWSIYLIDRQQETAEKVSVGKYGGMDWIQWSPDERYAVFLEKLEGTSWFIALNLETGDSIVMDELPAIADLERFSWTGDRTFEVPLSDGSTFQGSLEEG
mgnify:CR=1 FL=1